MHHAEAYQVIISNNGKIAILLHPQQGKQEHPYLLYDGRDHAFLYRNSRDVLLLDRLNPQVIDFLKNSESVVIIEADWETNQTINDYQVMIKHEKYT